MRKTHAYVPGGYLWRCTIWCGLFRVILLLIGMMIIDHYVRQCYIALWDTHQTPDLLKSSQSFLLMLVILKSAGGFWEFPPLLLLILSVAGRLDKIDLLWVRQRRTPIIVAYCSFLYFTGSNLPVLSTLLLCPRGYLVREHLKLIIQVLRKLLCEILSAASAINHGIEGFAFISYPRRAQKVIYHKFLSLEGKWVEMLSPWRITQRIYSFICLLLGKTLSFPNTAAVTWSPTLTLTNTLSKNSTAVLIQYKYIVFFPPPSIYQGRFMNKDSFIKEHKELLITLSVCVSPFVAFPPTSFSALHPSALGYHFYERESDTDWWIHS